MLKKWFMIYCIGIGFMIALLAGSEKVIQVIADSSADTREICIVLDAGHGYPDGGAISCTGIPECDINLEITRKLEATFHLLGYKTKMTRTTGESIYTQGTTIAQKKYSDLKERVRIVNETPKALLLSIHQNTFVDSRYSGPQVFYATTKGSDQLANLLQKNLESSLMPPKSRNAKQSGSVYLMDHINCTGLLIECGFISNPKEEALLRNHRYQQKLCCTIAVTIATFMTDS